MATTQPTVLPATTSSSNAGLLLPSFSLWWREIVRFYRQRARVVGVIASPLLFWVVIGSGFGTSFRSNGAAGGQHYLDYFFPGALIMIVLFTAIFTMMSVIEDRKEGFLLSVLVAPVSRSVIVLGKVLGGATLATAQGLIFLVFAPALGVHFTFASFGLTVLAIFLVAFSLTALGFIIAWPMDSTAGLSRRHQPVSDSAVAAVGIAVSALRRVHLDSPADAHQPVDLWHRGIALAALSRFGFNRPLARRQLCSAGSVHLDHVRLLVPGGQPPHHQACGLMQISLTFYPALNAVLNGSSAVLIGTGLYFIKRGRRQAHKRMMIAAFVTSTLFLISYLYYHLVLRAGITHFQGQGLSRPLYFTILISHTILAAVVVPFILITLARALKGNFARHKAIAPYTFAIWMYVSVTGVVIYLMLYKIFVG